MFYSKFNDNFYEFHNLIVVLNIVGFWVENILKIKNQSNILKKIPVHHC